MNECVETVQLKSEVQVEDDSDTQRAIMVVTGTTTTKEERRGQSVIRPLKFSLHTPLSLSQSCHLFSASQLKTRNRMRVAIQSVCVPKILAL